MVTHLAKINVLHLAESALQAATAGWVNAIAQAVHSLDEERETARIGRRLPAQECLFGHSIGDLASNEVVSLAAKLFYKVVSRSRVEDVELHGYVLIVQLLNET